MHTFVCSLNLSVTILPATTYCISTAITYTLHRAKRIDIVPSISYIRCLVAFILMYLSYPLVLSYLNRIYNKAHLATIVIYPNIQMPAINTLIHSYQVSGTSFIL